MLVDCGGDADSVTKVAPFHTRLTASGGNGAGSWSPPARPRGGTIGNACGSRADDDAVSCWSDDDGDIELIADDGEIFGWVLVVGVDRIRIVDDDDGGNSNALLLFVAKIKLHFWLNKT